MKEIRVVSIDMFGTLVDLRNAGHVFWRMLLKDRYSVELAEQCYAYLGNSWFEYISEERFISVKSIFVKGFAGLFSSVGIEFDPAEAAKLWAQQHPLSEPFSDSMVFLNSVGKKYLVCLASDTDDDMLGKLRKMYTFNYIFTSERLGLYKANADGRFFSAIFNHYGVRPEEILHIGDGRLEIVGAGKVGISTCWLNRTGLKWSHDTKPSYEVSSLTEAAAILGVGIDS